MGSVRSRHMGAIKSQQFETQASRPVFIVRAIMLWISIANENSVNKIRKIKLLEKTSMTSDPEMLFANCTSPFWHQSLSEQPQWSHVVQHNVSKLCHTNNLRIKGKFEMQKKWIIVDRFNMNFTFYKFSFG